MSKYIDAERLRAEINKRKKSLRAGICGEAFTRKQKNEMLVASEELDRFNRIIDSLQQEQPSLPDLDEAARDIVIKMHPCLKDCTILGDRLTRGQLMALVKAGAEWQKEQMLKEAVEGYVNYYEDSGGILMAEAQVGCPYHNGDKVKIIIVKEE